MAVGDFHRVTIAGHLYGQLINTTLIYRQTVLGAGDADVALCTRVDALYGGNVRPLLSQDYAYEQTLSQRFNPSPPLIAEIATANAGNGGIAFASIPPASCATVTKRSVNAGVKYRGRVFQAGIPVTHIASGGYIAANATNMTTAWNTLVTPVNGGYTFALVLYHRASGTFTNVFDMLARGILRQQRRREVGKGR